GCSSCHVPRYQTRAGEDVGLLSNQTIWPYTDLLLHDMGDALADGRPDYEATGGEWRTPPLWGLGLQTTVSHHDRLLHDGRARGPAEAILWHGGEAASAAAAFRGMNADERSALLAFLNSL
ncbi:MAG: putative thiol oxidoreductase with 2 cytochrome c heme-binding site, partial [Labilithrix sp.]|nr:putative thiol oxidoreductase with 2 cytochrome c heme-binding site [Labilithrix sp.]